MFEPTVRGELVEARKPFGRLNTRRHEGERSLKLHKAESIIYLCNKALCLVIIAAALFTHYLPECCFSPHHLIFDGD
jgi:hypothetical protein